MNLIGIVAGLTAFCSIWFGHVAVRKIESVSPTIWLPTLIFSALGLIVEILALSTPALASGASVVNRPWSIVFGTLGITLLFDALELTRQQNRVIKGHAPANPNNPRHAKILVEHSSATALDLLKREPIGHVISSDESTHLLSNL